MSYMDQRVSSSTHPSSSKREHNNYSDGSDEYDDEVPYKKSRESPTMNTSKCYVKIPENCVGLVIGRNGSEIQAISQKSGTRVTVSTDQDQSGFRLVEIVGEMEGMEAAKRLINDVIGRAALRPAVEVSQYTAQQQQVPPHLQPGEKITIDIPIPANKCGFVIGKGGETMRKLRSWSNCHIQLIQESNVANVVKPLRITGDPKSVEKARQLVDDILGSKEDTPAAALMAGNGPVATMSLTVKVPRCTVGAIMGLQGKTIRKMSEDTGTKIQFLPDDDPKLMERSLAIIGNRCKVHIAAQLIKDIVDANKEAASMPVSLFYMCVPASKCGLVIGRGGETIKQINCESGAHCELSKESTANVHERTFVIRGSEAQVDHAKHLIKVKVGDIPPNTPYMGMQAQMQQLQQPNIQMWSGQPIIQNPQQPPMHPQFQQQQQHLPPLLQQQMQQQMQPQLQQQQQFPPHMQPPHMQPSHIQPPHIQQQMQQQQQQQQMVSHAPTQQIFQPPVGADWQQLQARQAPQQFGHPAMGAQGFQQHIPQPVPQPQGPPGQAQFNQFMAATQVHQHPQIQQQQAQQQQLAAAVSTTPIKQDNKTEGKKDAEADGEADYSEQWLQYYITIGDKEAADGVRARIAEIKAKKAQKEAAARAGSSHY